MIEQQTMFTLPSKSTGEVRTVVVHTAQSGAHRGEQYFSCSCPAGRFSWSPAGFRPCKHVTAVLQTAGVTLVDGHFRQ